MAAQRKKEDPSNCPEPFRLFAYFFGSEGFVPDHDRRLVEHVEGCRRCRKLLEDWETADRRLASTTPRIAPPEIEAMAARIAAGGDVLAVIKAEPHLKLSLPEKIVDLLGFRLLPPMAPEPIRSAEQQSTEKAPTCRIEAVDPSTLGLHFYGSESMIGRIAPADFVVVYSESEKGKVVGRVARSRPTELRVRFPDVDLNLPFHILIIQ